VRGAPLAGLLEALDAPQVLTRIANYCPAGYRPLKHVEGVAGRIVLQRVHDTLCECSATCT
jgi:hypothetical protein